VAENKIEHWRNVIAEQESSMQKIGPFCREHGISEPSFYYWRSRLRKSAPVRFAVIGTVPPVVSRPVWTLELVLRNGDRLRIGDKVDAVTLRTVLEAARG
jgi:transposase-like protein